MTEQVDVVVIGGGPAGSTVASFLQLMGHRVLLLERERFPRHHIGESMIAATIDVLAEVGLEEKLASAGFPVKSGGCFIWGESESPWCIRFEEIPGRPTSYQVKRDVFDKLLLDHSASLGVDVREEHRVTGILQEDGRVIGVTFETGQEERGEVRAGYTIDASGLNAVVANKVSRRTREEELKNVALYGYWRGQHPAPAKLGGEIREHDRNNIIIKWIGDGWLWFIPLGHGQLISVGYVTPSDTLPEGRGRGVLEPLYLEKVRSAIEYDYLLSNSEYTSEFHTISDWSYRSEAMAGPGYFAVGDAACFVDPILSSGVYLATLHAKMCAIGVNTCLREPDQEHVVQEWYEGLYADAYNDYLQMARFWYRGSRSTARWMHEARAATSADTTFAESDRASFLGLATGNTHAHPSYVFLQQLKSFPFPLQLRKDPRGGFHREAQVILRRHAVRTGAVTTAATANAAARAMSASVGRKGAVARLLGEQPPVQDQFKVTTTDAAALRIADLSVSPATRFSLEVLDDVVAMVVTAPSGERRRLGASEQGLLAALASSGPPSAGESNGELADPQVAAFYGEMLGAGVIQVAIGSSTTM